MTCRSVLFWATGRGCVAVPNPRPTTSTPAFRTASARRRALLLAADTQRDVAEREKALAPASVNWRVIEPEVFVSVAGATLTRQADGSLLASGPHGPTDTYTTTFRRWTRG